MTKSEMSLLRKEIAKLAAEIMNLRKENSEIKATLNKKITLLEVENDRLNLEIAARDRPAGGQVREFLFPLIHKLQVQRITRSVSEEELQRG